MILRVRALYNQSKFIFGILLIFYAMEIITLLIYDMVQWAQWGSSDGKLKHLLMSCVIDRICFCHLYS